MSSMLFIGMMEVQAEVIYAIPLQGAEFQIGTMLEWATAKETESHLFVVEKSIDGFTFEGIGEVNAAGASEKDKGYRFLDANPGGEIAFYRLRQIDTDGTTSYSEVIELDKEIPNNFTVTAMTNTTTSNWLEIGLESALTDQLNYKVKNSRRESILKGTQNLTPGLNAIAFNLENELEGTYYVIMTLGEEQEEIVIRKIDDEVRKKPNVASKKKNGSG